MLAIAALLCVYRIAQLPWIGYLCCCMKWLKGCVAATDTPDAQSRDIWCFLESGPTVLCANWTRE
jgi:hypothetical protein